MKKRAILFNGPPGSGKDTATNMARNFLDNRMTTEGQIKATHMKFSAPLKQAAHVLYGIPYSAEYYERTQGYDWKNKKQIEFFGQSPRDIYIALSEEFAKKYGGESFFGHIAARTIGLDKSFNTYIFSDSGFAGEAKPIIAALGIENILIVELKRDGCTFEGDSRGYIGDRLLEDYRGKIAVKRLSNNQDKLIYRIMVQAVVAEWFGLDVKAEA